MHAFGSQDKMLRLFLIVFVSTFIFEKVCNQAIFSIICHLNFYLCNRTVLRAPFALCKGASLTMNTILFSENANEQHQITACKAI